METATDCIDGLVVEFFGVTYYRLTRLRRHCEIDLSSDIGGPVPIPCSLMFNLGVRTL